MMILFFDTETTGIVLGMNRKGSGYRQDAVDITNPGQPYLVQLGAMITDEEGKVVEEYGSIVRPDGYRIPVAASNIHGITTEKAEAEGKHISDVLAWFCHALRRCNKIVCHNLKFDRTIMHVQLYRYRKEYMALLAEKPSYCTMVTTTDLLKIPGYYGKYKWPKLMELYTFLFGKPFEGAHDAMADIRATVMCFFELRKKGLVGDFTYQ